MSMTNEERQEWGAKRWEAASVLWKMRLSEPLLAQVFGFKDRHSLATRISQLRQKYPEKFPPRPQGFVPLDTEIRELAKTMRLMADSLDLLFQPTE